MAAKIQQRNEEMNRKCTEVYEAIRKKGFECAVLKGQGVAEIYRIRNEELGIMLTLGFIGRVGILTCGCGKKGCL